MRGILALSTGEERYISGNYPGHCIVGDTDIICLDSRDYRK